MRAISCDAVHQGDLYFPPDAVPAERQGDVVVAVLHHPYTWIQADAARALRRRIEGVADLILTGHEHDATIRAQQGNSGERNIYIERGALQDAYSPDESTFHVFVLDVDAQRQKTARFVWNGDRYVVLGGGEHGDAFGLDWEEFQVTRLRERGEFHLAERMEEYLDDPGVNLLHQSRGTLRLRDIFTYPDLEAMSAPLERIGRFVRGPRVADVIADVPRLLIVGDAQSGKTTLGKMAYRLLREAGYVPVLLDARGKVPVGERLHGLLIEQFGEQYDVSAKDAYRQLDRSRRVVIVDDYHLMQLNAGSKRAFVEALMAFAGKVIIFANDLILEAADILAPDARAQSVGTFTSYRLLPLGYVGRDTLVEKWLLLSEGADGSGPEFAHRRDTITRTLNGLIGQNWLPPHPIYVLAVLQASEGATPVDSRVSTYGGYYELFIRAALARDQGPVEYSIIINYLAHLAYTLFSERRDGVDGDGFAAIHHTFERRYEIGRNMASLVDDLVVRNILVRRGDEIRFKYKYVFYYFVASWMRDHVGEPEVRGDRRSQSRGPLRGECSRSPLPRAPFQGLGDRGRNDRGRPVILSFHRAGDVRRGCPVPALTPLRSEQDRL